MSVDRDKVQRLSPGSLRQLQSGGEGGFSKWDREEPAWNLEENSVFCSGHRMFKKTVVDSWVKCCRGLVEMRTNTCPVNSAT